MEDVVVIRRRLMADFKRLIDKLDIMASVTDAVSLEVVLNTHSRREFDVPAFVNAADLLNYVMPPNAVRREFRNIRLGEEYVSIGLVHGRWYQWDVTFFECQGHPFIYTESARIICNEIPNRTWHILGR